MIRFSFLTAVFCLMLTGINAQNEVDALRYSRQLTVGTARAVGLGGAVGALGADFTALSINPAGIGLYRGSEVTLSPSIFWDNTRSQFLGNSYEETSYNPNIGNFGFVSTYDNKQENGWMSVNFAFGYNRIANFNRNAMMSGVNNNNSLLDNFADYANENPNDLSSFYEKLAYDVSLLPYDTSSINNGYWNDIQNGGYGQLQRRSLNSGGSAGEYTFSFGANYNHRLYLGGTFGIFRLRFEQDIIHTEHDFTNSIEVFDKFIFRENLNTSGNGYTFKMGVIGRPVDVLRVGFSYHFPVFYNLYDNFTTDIEAYFDADNDYDLSYEKKNSPLGEYEYKLKTPSRLVGSFALTLGKMGLISMDYERVDHTNAKLSASDYDFFNENEVITGLYKKTNNLRIGGELRFGTSYLRGGYSYYQSPYISVEPNTNTNLNTFSTGIGIRGRLFFFDLGYSLSNVEEMYYMYLPQMTEGSKNKSQGNNLIMTIGYRF